MDTFNFFENQLVGVQDMMSLQSNQGAVRDILASLLDYGVISGMGIFPTTPNPSLAVSISNGKLALPDGNIVTTTAATVDLSSYVRALTLGQSQWLTIYAVSTRLSDTPVVTPQGTTIQFRTYDAAKFVVMTGVAVSGIPLKSVTAPAAGGVLIADVEITYGQTAITAASIDASRAQLFVRIPDLLGVVRAGAPPWPISDITGLQAALDSKLNVNANIPESQVSGLPASLASLQNQITAQANKEASDLAAVNGSLNSHQAEITTLQGQMGTVQSTQVNHTSQIAGLQTTTSNQAATLATHTGQISTLNTQMGTANSELGSLLGFMNVFGATLNAAKGHLWIGGPSGFKFLVQWSQGAHDAAVAGTADNDFLAQIVNWDIAFPNACLYAGVSTYLLTANVTSDYWYQTQGFDTGGCHVIRCRSHNDAGREGDFNSGTMPIVFGFGY